MKDYTIAEIYLPDNNMFDYKINHVVYMIDLEKLKIKSFILKLALIMNKDMV